MDHCYSRPWNWRPDTNLLRPTKTLFMLKTNSGKRNKKFAQQQAQAAAAAAAFSSSAQDEYVDVDSDVQPPPAIYDVAKAKYLMEECERYAGFARVNEGNEDWEATIPRHTWTIAQNRLFNSMSRILNDDRAARLAHAGNWNEPILRRTVIDKSVKRTRQLLAGVSWDARLTQWLHLLLIEHLSTCYLGAYLDILQTLRCKLPTFVDKMMFGPTAATRIGLTSNESLFPLLKRQWDPVAASLAHDKPKKLPGNPVIVIVPSSPSLSGPHPSKRLHKWTTLLNNLASVITVHANIGNRVTMVNCTDQMFAATRAKVQEIRSDCPGRPIVLAGFNTGAAIACQVAQVEPVLAIVCLGFPLLTTEGKRGEAEDSLLDIQCPTLFIVGQNAYITSQEDMEDLRERMRVETGLVVVGSADDYLRINKNKKRSEGITQSIVDRCVVDEVGEFIGSILLSPYPPAVRPPMMYHQNEANKRNKMDRKRNNSNCSSVESEPPSPQPIKVSRPVGRPPGPSKKKLMMDAKQFPPQLIQGTPSPQSISVSPTPNVIPPASPSSDTYTSDTASASTNRSVSISDDFNLCLTQDSDSSVTAAAINNTAATTTTTMTTTPTTTTTIITTDSSAPVKNAVITPASQTQTVTPTADSSTPQTVPHSMMPHYTSRTMIPASGASTLSNLLQASTPQRTSIASFRNTATGSTASNSIKVLENIKLSSGTGTPGNKIMSSAGRLIDMSKITVLNSLNAQKNNNLGNVILLPEGSKGGVRNMTMQNIKGHHQKPYSHKGQGMPKRAKYITSKKQLLNNSSHCQPQQRPPPPIATTSYITTHADTTKLPPPSNLTTADIMDLPIIFADNDSTLLSDINNQTYTSQPIQTSPIILTTTTTTTAVAPGAAIKQNLPQIAVSTASQGKYVFINKQPTVTGQTVTYQAGMKRPLAQPGPRTGPQPGVKYTKIILSKRGDDGMSKMQLHPQIQQPQPQQAQQVISKVSGAQDLSGFKQQPQQQQLLLQQPKVDDSMIPFDLENELVATAVPKPQYQLKTEKVEPVSPKISTITKSGGLLEAVLKNESPLNLKKPSLPPTSKTLNQLFQDLDSNPDDPDPLF